MNDPAIQALAETVSDIAAHAAITYLKQQNLTATDEALAACLASWIRLKLPEAFADAKQAIDSGMEQYAEMTFRATMALAGIEAAKEAGVPRLVN